MALIPLTISYSFKYGTRREIDSGCVWRSPSSEITIFPDASLNPASSAADCPAFFLKKIGFTYSLKCPNSFNIFPVESVLPSFININSYSVY